MEANNGQEESHQQFDGSYRISESGTRSAQAGQGSSEGLMQKGDLR